MRCRNCGWENDLGNSRCVKCDAPLNGPIVDNEPPLNESYSHNILKGTVRENGHISVDNPESNSIGTCSKCNYPYNPGMGACPNCGYDANKGDDVNPFNNDNKRNKKDVEANSHSQKDLLQCPFCEEMVPSKFKFCANCGKPFKMGTVNPWAGLPQVEEVVNCTLTPVAWENEDLDIDNIQYTGESILLNRDNTEPNNSSITSKVQAIITYEDKKWFIEDKSQRQTTFKHISKKTQLEDGDIILLGNRKFIFNKK